MVSFNTSLTSGQTLLWVVPNLHEQTTGISTAVTRYTKNLRENNGDINALPGGPFLNSATQVSKNHVPGKKGWRELNVVNYRKACIVA